MKNMIGSVTGLSTINQIGSVPGLSSINQSLNYINSEKYSKPKIKAEI